MTILKHKEKEVTTRTMTKTEPPQWLLAFWKEIDDKAFGKGFDCFTEDAICNLGVADWHGREEIARICAPSSTPALPRYTMSSSTGMAARTLVTAAGVTAGLDAALVVASLLRGDAIAQEIQLSIQYAPNPVFHSGTPETAPAEVLHAFNKSYSTIAVSREAEARRFAAILGVAV